MAEGNNLEAFRYDGATGAVTSTPLRDGGGASFWPFARDVALAAIAAITLTWIEIEFSRRFGLLAYPPFYDGVGYLLEAKRLFYRLWLEPAGVLQSLGVSKTPLWQILMMFDFLVLGEGEWQAHAVRFWPTFLLLLLVIGVVRRHGGLGMALVAAVFTSLLPTISVGLRSTLTAYSTGSVDFPLGPYLADLRPDLLFAVLLLWATVPLVERARDLDRRALVLSGLAAGLAILAKASAFPMLLLGWGVAQLYVVVVNRRQIMVLLRMAPWALLSFAGMTTPWAIAGGLRDTVAYLRWALTEGRSLYADPHATLLSSARYYWELLPYHLGPSEGWSILALGFVCLVVCGIKDRSLDERWPGYVAVAGALFALVTLTPNRNWFLGLPCYLLLWLLAWAALGEAASRARARGAAIRTLVSLSALYAVTLGLGSLYALEHWPPEERRAGPENRAVTQAIARDLKSILMPRNPCFIYPPMYGSPATLLYYMMDESGVMVGQPTLERNEQCKAVVVFVEDMNEVGRFFTSHYQQTWPTFRAIAEWVRRPGSPYRLAKEYHFSDATHPPVYRLGDGNRRGFTLQLFVKESSEPPVGR
jgi:hypothetical protein